MLLLRREPAPRLANNQLNAVVDLIDGWYAGCGGVNNLNCNACIGPQCQDSFHSGYTPAGWTNQQADTTLYQRVVRVTCRGCHIMQPSFDWTKVSQFTDLPVMGGFKDRIQTFVCTGNGQPSNQRRMPHAEVPFKTFWQSNDVPGLFKQAPMNFAQCARQ